MFFYFFSTKINFQFQDNQDINFFFQIQNKNQNQKPNNADFRQVAYGKDHHPGRGTFGYYQDHETEN